MNQNILTLVGLLSFCLVAGQLTTGCTNEKEHRNDLVTMYSARVEHRNKDIEGCQYIESFVWPSGHGIGYSLTHKGDCTNVHRYINLTINFIGSGLEGSLTNNYFTP